MTLQVARLGSYATPKVAFKGKGFSSGSSGKGQSSSSSERTERPRRTKATNPSSQTENVVEKAGKKVVKGASDAASDIAKLKLKLVGMLDKYADNAEMRKIILEQLRKLG